MFRPQSNRHPPGSYHKHPKTSRPHPKPTKPQDDDIVEVKRVLKGYPHPHFWREYKVNFQRAGWFKHATGKTGKIKSLRKLKLGDNGEFVMEMIKGDRIVKNVVDFLMESYQQFLKQHHPELYQNADESVDDDVEEAEDEYEEDSEDAEEEEFDPEEYEEPNDFQKLTKQMEKLTAMVQAQHKEIKMLRGSDPESD